VKTCSSSWIPAEVFEGMIDELFATKLTSPEFFDALFSDLNDRAKKSSPADAIRRIETAISSLSRERERVLKSFEKGFRTEEQTDAMIVKLDAELARTKDELSSIRPIANPLSGEELAELFAPCLEWKNLSSLDRRRILSSIVLDIRVAASKDHVAITGITLATDGSVAVNAALVGVLSGKKNRSSRVPYGNASLDADSKGSRPDRIFIPLIA